MNATQREEMVCMRTGFPLSGKEFKQIQRALEQQELDAGKACADGEVR